MRIRLAIPDRYATAPVLDAALEATTRAATSQMRAGAAPTFSDLMRQGVQWKPENYTDGEHFDLPEVIGERGHGDCDDLAPALAAELRATGADPGAAARVVRTGPERWHAIVRLSDGTILDPSVMAGMKGRRGVQGAIARPMASVGESAIAVAPWRGRWYARTDVPWDDGHLSSLAHSTDMARALDRSIAGAISCGNEVLWKHSADRAMLGALYTEAAEAGDFSRASLRDDGPWQRCGECGPWIARFV